MQIDASELNRLAVDLGQATDKVLAGAAVAIRKSALDIEADAKNFAPVDTGNLRNSIGHSDLRRLTPSSGVLEVEIGPTASYGAYVEFGTSRMAPRAYMGPAYDRRAGEFVDAMEYLTDGIL